MARDLSAVAAGGRPALATLDVQFQELMAAAPVAAFLKDSEGRYVYANPYMLARMGMHMGVDWQGKSDAEIWPPEAAAAIRVRDAAVLKGAGPQGFTYVMKSPSMSNTLLLVEFLVPGLEGSAIGGIALDVTSVAQTDTEHAQLVAAINHAADSVMMVSLDGSITDVNASFERASGYLRAEVIGRNPRLLKSGIQPCGFYEAMWTAIVSGKQWSGELVNRRKDGSFYIVEAVISPVLGAEGESSGYVAVSRDVTVERALAASSARAASEHSLVLAVARDLRPDSTPETKAQAICRRVAGLTRIGAAQLLVFEPDGHAMPFGYAVAGREDPPRRHLPYQMGRSLRARAAFGPWTEPWSHRGAGSSGSLLENVGPSALACAPVCFNDRVIGLLVAQSLDVADKGAVDELLPAVVEFADLAGALLGPDVAARMDAQGNRQRIRDIIEHRTFRPVFQPIVDITLNKVVGYEALTRYTDGSDPEALFVEAAALGLGVELERATLKASLEAATSLPESAWLDLNASPELILAGGRLHSLLGKCRRRLVLEVTEHDAIVDYPAFRIAMANLGPTVEFAVDDAGSGFASLRHILELGPAFVKLDRWLIAGLENDEARQAMLVGMKHFARKTGCRLIAEGVESERDVAVLRDLDIRLAQGYILGRPQPAAVYAGQSEATK
jgi:PAS domain S-box-containing protein